VLAGVILLHSYLPGRRIFARQCPQWLPFSFFAFFFPKWLTRQCPTTEAVLASCIGSMLSLITIAFAWLRYRPVKAAILISIGILCFMLPTILAALMSPTSQKWFAGPYRHRRFMAIAGEMRGPCALHSSVSLDLKYVGRSFLIRTPVLKIVLR